MCPGNRGSTTHFLYVRCVGETGKVWSRGERTSHLFVLAVDSEQEAEESPFTHLGVGLRQKCETIYVHFVSFIYNISLVFPYKFVVDFHYHTRRIKGYISCVKHVIF